jgi:hypothetical protein
MPCIYRLSDAVRAVEELPVDENHYLLMITAVHYRRHETSPDCALLSFAVEVAEGPSRGRCLSDIDVVNPEEDYSKTVRIILAALGYRAGIDDRRFVQEHPDDDFSLCSESSDFQIGSGYAALIGKTFSARVKQSRDEDTNRIRHSYRSFEPLPRAV